MKKQKLIQLALMLMLSIGVVACFDNASATVIGENTDFQITAAQVFYYEDLQINVWDITVEGVAGATRPVPVGQLDGAPVDGYVFPTTLKASDVGFGNVDGIVAMALTAHPDFDDTPLWDENNDTRYDNDGIEWHAHWVVLVDDQRVAGGLSVKQFDPADQTVVLPPTNPGIPMYMDSPGFHVITNGTKIRVVIPLYRMNHQYEFQYDGVAAAMRVNTSDSSLPMLGVYEVHSVASGDLSLPYQVEVVR